VPSTPSMRGPSSARARGWRFLATGALNSLLGLAVIYFLKYFAGWSDFTANLLGYIAGPSGIGVRFSG
jgi:putative flippase GtrA